MDRDDQQQPCPSPYPEPSSSFLKDISNFKTPKRSSHISNFTSPSTQSFFTASKQTPNSMYSFRRPSLSGRTKPKLNATARRLKAFEVEQSQSSRKVQIRKEQSLKSLAKSLATWLNFLFENPERCSCKMSVRRNLPDSAPTGLGKRRESDGGGGDGATWRSPKRQRDVMWNGGEDNEDDTERSKEFVKLRSSLKDVCSFDDLKQRMRGYLSLADCKDILKAMTLVVKNIDEGRLKMKAHCPIVTDMGMKENAVRMLMSYNPIWVRIGLYIIFGGDSLLPNGDMSSDKEIAFLKMVIEKQFFSHPELAKTYAYNKKVEGLYRPGYYEKLGSVILKRFLLLVLVLDKAKSHSSLSLKHGIDGIDGGSPLLFIARSSIKSSRQMIYDFLSSEVMLGEGNLLTHLAIVGYRVSYEQSPLVEYDFRVTDLFVHIQDGVRLCRAIQLLRNDPSILTKMTVPFDNSKKKMANCGVALQYLKLAGVPLHDEDDMMIMEDDIVTGDKELTVSLLWNVFVHLQVPLLLDQTILVKEIMKIHGADEVSLSSAGSSPSHLELLLNWIQAVCEKYDHRVDNFSSLVDGKAIWCLLDYYFRKELLCADPLKAHDGGKGEESIMSANDYTDAVHNFILSQKLTTTLGNFPEVMQISDILEHSGAINDRSVVILLVFLSSQLTAKKTMDELNFHKLLGCICQSPERRHSSVQRCTVKSKGLLDQEEMNRRNDEDAARKFRTIKAWWQDMADQNKTFVTKPVASTLQSNSTSKPITIIQRENAAKVIQSHFRRSIEHHKILKTNNAISFLQTVIRAWLLMKQKRRPHNLNTFMMDKCKYGRSKQSEQIGRHVNFMVDRYGFLKLRGSVMLIQRAVRIWMKRKHQNGSIRSHVSQHLAATKIQAHFRAWLLRTRFLNQKQAITRIQSHVRCLKCWKNFQQHKIATRSAIIIQCHIRGRIVRREAERRKHLISVLQKCCRGWLIRRDFLLRKEAATKIQSAIRCFNCWKRFQCRKCAAIEIQRFVRGQITRKRLLGSSRLYRGSINYYNFQSSRMCFRGFELNVLLSSLLKLQRWWRRVLLLKLRTKSAITIQSHVRGWIGRHKVSREKQHIILLQAYWKGYLARKEASRQLVDLRLRMLKSAKNVDDSKRIINRLLVAILELSSMKSVSGILHTCATLDMATEHSQKCCEELVAAGAIDHLLKLIRSATRSVPDLEILRHALSVLNNLARYPHLTTVLIESHRSVETILWELLRNKEEGYFIAAEVLKRICANKNGVEAVHKLPKLPSLVKRLFSLVEELTRKVNMEKRKPRNAAARENAERRLREGVELLKLLT